MDQPQQPHPHHPQLMREATSEMIVGSGLGCAGALQIVFTKLGAPQDAHLFLFLFGITNICVGLYLAIPAWVRYRSLLAEHKTQQK